jgi:hypothetical protein
VNAEFPGLPGDIGPSEPGLDQLLELLTASPAPDELTGESAALAMFRASQQPAGATAAAEPAASAGAAGGAPATVPAPAAPAASGRRGPRRYARRAVRLAVVATVALAGGFAAAAYTEVLPAPAQHVAYRMLGFAGVPDVHRSTRGTPAPGGAHPAGPAPARSGSAATGSPRRSAGPAASASRAARQPAASRSAAAAPAVLSLTVARGQVAAGASDLFTGSLTGQGRPMQGAKLSLFERATGQPGWELAGAATTGSDGRAVFTAADLASNALFRLTGPDAAVSRPVPVTVIPPVSASLAGGPHGGAYVLTASSPLAVPGDAIVLQVQSGGGWLSVRVHQLDSGDLAEFAVRPHLRARVYRVVLPATAAHGRSVSNPVTVLPG